mgnify:CR=1 FL=1
MSGGLTIHVLVEETSAYAIARQRLWLTAEGDRLVPDGDPDAASLFVAAGHRISRQDAERFGLLGGAGEALAEVQDVGEVPDGGAAEDAEAEPLELSDEERAGLPEISAEDAEADPPATRRGRTRKGG